MAGIKIDLAYANRTITRPGLLFNRIIHRSIPQTLAQEAAISSALGETKLSVRNSRIVLETDKTEMCLEQMTAARILQKAGISSITIPEGMEPKQISTALHAVMSRWPGATARILGEAEGKPGRMFLPEEMKQNLLIKGAKNGSILDLYELIRTGCSPDKITGIKVPKESDYKPHFLTRLFGRTDLSPFYWIARRPNTPTSVLFLLACAGDGYALEAFKTLGMRKELNADKETKATLSASPALYSFCLANKNKYNYDHSKKILAIKGEMSENEKYYLMRIYNGMQDDEDSLEKLYQGSQTLNKLADSSSLAVREAVISHPKTSIDTLVKLARSSEGYAARAFERLDLRLLNLAQITLLACGNNAKVSEELAQQLRAAGILKGGLQSGKLGEYVFNYFTGHYTGQDLNALFANRLLLGQFAKHPYTYKKDLVGIIQDKKKKKEALIAFDNLGKRLSADDLEDIAESSLSKEIRSRIVNHQNVSISALLKIASGADESSMAALRRLDLNGLPTEDLLFLLCSQGEDVQKTVISHIKTDSRFIGIDTNTDVADAMACRLLKSTPISIARARKLYAHATKMTKLVNALKAYIRECAITSVSGNTTFEQALDEAMLFGGPAASAYNAIKKAGMLSTEVLMYLAFSPVPFVSTKTKEFFKKAAVEEAVCTSKIPNIKKEVGEKIEAAIAADRKKATEAIRWLKDKDLLTPAVSAYLQLNDLPYLAMENLTGF